jgi:hypothetical protein
MKKYLYIILFFFLTTQTLFANPSIKIDGKSVKVKKVDNEILIKGQFTATGLNTSGIPERDDVSIFLEVKTTPNSFYPIFYEYYSIGKGCLIYENNCINESLEKGINIKSFPLFSASIRQSPVWLKYGGLGKWEKNAPNTVTMKFEGKVTLPEKIHDLRIHAILKHIIGGPYAAWPGISYYHDTKELNLKKYASSTNINKNTNFDNSNKNQNKIQTKINKYVKEIRQCRERVANGQNLIKQLEKNKSKVDNKVLYQHAGLSPTGYEAIVEDIKSLRYQNLAGYNPELIERDIYPLKHSHDLAVQIRVQKLYIDKEIAECNRLREELQNLKKQLINN